MSSTVVLSRGRTEGTPEPRHPFRRWLSGRRAWIEVHPRILVAYRAAVAVIGIAVVLAGVILIPLPGPGWLVVFLGFAILGTEFAVARRFNAFLRRTLARARAWWIRRRAGRRAGQA